MEKLTNSQKSIWVTEQYYKGSSVNTICGSAIIDEKIDFEKLEKSIQIVCKKHDNFKIKLKLKDGEIFQEFANEEVKIEFINLANEKEFEKFRIKTIEKPFDLKSQLFKFYIIKFENGKGAFMLNIHHLISDAWTLALICNDIIKTYSALKNNQKVETKAIYSYIDYITSEKEYQKSEKYQKDKKYWEEKYQTIPEVATIPGSKKEENNLHSVIGKRKQFKIEKTQVEKLKKYCKKNNISLFNFFMAIYAIYLSEISNLDDFAIGTPILNRTNFKEKNATGMFINMAPLRINLNGVKTFREFAKNIALESLGMLKHQKYSYQSLLEDLREKNKDIPNLYNILISYQITNAQTEEGNIKYKTEWTFNGCCAENMDIQIYDLNDTGNLNIAYDYKVSIYEESDIEKLHKRIECMILQVLKHENIEIKDIEIVTSKEKEKLIYQFNQTDFEYDKNKPIIKYFEEQVEKTPNNVAIVFENKKMTYRELNEKANSLATKLREEGVKNNSIIGIVYSRSFEILIAMLAILKAGGAYIPIAPDYPDDRIKYMLEDSNVKILLTSKQEENRIKTVSKKICINLTNKEIYDKNKTNIENISKPDDLSYLIYTSGSTGTPKGVMLKQQNLSNFYNAMKEKIDYLKDGKNHKIVSITTISFDIFGFETLISLTNGLTVYMTNENEQKVTMILEKFIKNNQIEIIQTTPSIMKFHLENLEHTENISSLKYIMLAGEQLPKTLVNTIEKKLPDVTIFNGYGPSETTIFSTVENVTNQSKITIGKPIANTQIYILNKNKKLLPDGMMGEIYISGDGVGKGYINKIEQTKNNYIPNPFIKEKIMYKTGDLGYFDSNGKIICCGRIDHQVKIKGLRIELGEVEECINAFKPDHLLKSVVIVKNDGKKSVLHTFITYPTKICSEKLKQYLLKKLPNYMQPATITQIEKFPITPNGKIDRKLLQKYEIKKEDKVKYIKPRNSTEKVLVEIIKDKLELKEFGIDNNIFEFGADSLTVINIITELFKYNFNIKVNDIYKYKTVRKLYENIIINKKRVRLKEKDYDRFIKIEEKTKKFTKDIECKKINEKYNIFLTGSTGFFGSHLISELLDNKENINKIYCAIRPRKNTTPKKRLLNKIKFYFGDKYNELFDKYIEIVECEIEKEQFNLNYSTYKKIQDNVDIVIHAAADVRHYGKYSQFVKSNIISTQNIVDFCKGKNIDLHYISTMTVSGNYLIRQDNQNTKFDENCFYIGQHFEENVYVKSKLVAESIVINNIDDKFNATIYRLGDLTGRYTDGGFQDNIEKNATYLRLKSILKIGAIPKNILNMDLEFTPIDFATQAIRKIIWSNNYSNRIFNIYNPNMIKTEELLKIIKKKGYMVKSLSNEKFINLVKNISKDKEKQKILVGIINDFTDNKDLIYNYTIKQTNEITQKYLKNLDFQWKNVDENYIIKLLDYMKKVKFI